MELRDQVLALQAQLNNLQASLAADRANLEAANNDLRMRIAIHQATISAQTLAIESLFSNHKGAQQ